MARITFSPIIAAASGKAADAVFSNWKGRGYIRKLVTPANPQSAAQILVRESLARCVELYRSLDNQIKTWLDTYGTNYTISGYNVFVKNNRALEQATSLLKPVPDSPYQLAPTSFAVAADAADGSKADATWVNNAEGDYDTTTIFVRDDSGNIFAQFVLNITPADAAYTISGLASGTSYQCYAAFYDTTNLLYGSAGSDTVTTS